MFLTTSLPASYHVAGRTRNSVTETTLRESLAMAMAMATAVLKMTTHGFPERGGTGGDSPGSHGEVTRTLTSRRSSMDPAA